MVDRLAAGGGAHRRNWWVDLVQYAYDDGECVIETLESNAGVW